MNEHDFDELVVRLTSEANRRNAVKGLAGGALATFGAAAIASAKDGKGKTKKQTGRKANGKQATIETNAVGNGERILCRCSDTDPTDCETVRVKKDKAKKIFKKHPNSNRGPCDATTTTTTTPPPQT